MPLVFDTETVPPEERFDFWVEGALRTFFPFDLRRRTESSSPFRGTVRQYLLGPLALTRVVSEPTTITRTPAEIAAYDPETIQLTLQLRGRSVYTQDDRATAMTPGVLMMHDVSRPFTIRSEGPIELIVLETSKALLGSSIDWAREHTVEPLRGIVAEGLIAPFVRELAVGLDTGAVSEVDSQHLGESVVNLVRSLCGPPAAYGEGKAKLLTRVKLHIDEHIHDPALTPDSIARAHFCSTRHLQKLFRAEGHTITGWIRDRRLAGARRDLRDPALADDTVLTVAMRWGLMNAAHFSRTFRAVYGCTPTECRVAAFD